MIDEATSIAIQNSGINVVPIKVEDNVVKVIGNHFVDAKGYLSFDPLEAGINEWVYYPVLRELLDGFEGTDDELKELLKANINRLIPKHIIEDDMFAFCIELHRSKIRHWLYGRYRPSGKQKNPCGRRAFAKPAKGRPFKAGKIC